MEDGGCGVVMVRLDLAVGVGTFGLKSYEPKIGGGIHDLAALAAATRWYSATPGHRACARTYSTSCVIFHAIRRNLVWACTYSVLGTLFALDVCLLPCPK